MEAFVLVKDSQLPHIPPILACLSTLGLVVICSPTPLVLSERIELSSSPYKEDALNQCANWVYLVGFPLRLSHHGLSRMTPLHWVSYRKGDTATPTMQFSANIFISGWGMPNTLKSFGRYPTSGARSETWTLKTLLLRQVCMPIPSISHIGGGDGTWTHTDCSNGF